MHIKQIGNINAIDAEAWNTVVGFDYPFIRHEFLLALEESACVSAKTGWQPQHLLLYATKQLIACMPLYLKNHSRGEYVFDHQWAQSYAHHSINYYPKWVTAVPFTPCQGQRIFTLPETDERQSCKLLLNYMQTHADAYNISSWHCLFAQQQQAEFLQTQGLSLRNDVQFHWFNRAYQDFSEFLSALNSHHRKNINRERRRINEQGIKLLQITGTEISQTQLRQFFKFYQMTYLKKGMSAYLNMDFFTRIVRDMPEQLLFVFAQKDRHDVAAALSFIGPKTLYGRYWGCFEEYHSLHFETCYYQGIDYCIKHQLQKFDSGAQGEHKIARGFEPMTTYSAHWIKHPEFAHAIQQFVDRECIAVAHYKSQAESYLPFKKGHTKI